VAIRVAARPATPPAAPLAASPAAPAPVTLRIGVSRVSVFGRSGSLVRCRVTSGSIAACSAALLAGGHVVARGRASAPRRGARAVTVRLRLTKRGRTLLDQQLGGAVARLAATASTSGGTRSARGRSRAVLAVERLTTPAGSWLPNQAAISPTGRRFLQALRGRLIAVTAVRCDGFTAKVARNPPNAVRISARRAAIACSALQRLGAHATATAVGHGDARPIASNHTFAGRARNRRVEITIRHTPDAERGQTP